MMCRCIVPCKALKPSRGTLDDPVTNCSTRALISSSNDSTTCNTTCSHSNTTNRPIETQTN